jgi:ATP-dependent DNA helicase PIF1
MKHNYNIS